jgi:hypothetical protein
MEIISWIAFLAGAAFYWWVIFQDSKTSSIYPMTTSGEANWWLRGKDGYYSKSTHLRNAAIWFGVMLAAAIIIPTIDSWVATDYAPMVAGGSLAVTAGLLWATVSKNVRVHAAIRDEQLAILANIKKDPANAKAYLGDAELHTDKKGSEFWMFKHFYDLRAVSDYQVSEGTHEDHEGKYYLARTKAEAELIPRFVKLANLPVGEQFVVGRASKV